MRALLATHRLGAIAGSEVVTLEFAKSLTARGFGVDVYANHFGRPMAEYFANLPGVRLREEPATIKPFTYDVAYFQHQVAGLFDYGQCDDERESTLIVFGRLGRRTILESGGWAHDNALGDISIANSELTAERLAETGVRHDIHTFYNAAPDEFFFTRDGYKDAPENILVITNHRDKSLLGAMKILRRSFRVQHIGRYGSPNTLIAPSHIRAADVVVSIGKSAQYALASRTPLYVYDHFGGPGYLDSGNFSRAQRYSFSGRCCERKLTPTQIAEEIVAGYREQVRYVRGVDPASLEMFKLEKHIHRLLSLPTRSNEDKRRSLADPNIELERMLAHHFATARDPIALNPRLHALVQDLRTYAAGFRGKPRP